MQSKVMTNDASHRREFKERALQRVNQALVSEEQAEESSPIEVHIPRNFYNMTGVELHGYLSTQELTPEQIVDAIEQFSGNTQHTHEFKFVLEPPVYRKEEALEPAAPKPIVSVEVPSDFTKFKNKDQYLYLTKQCALTTRQANDVIDTMAGKETADEYKISFSEAVHFDNPLDKIYAVPDPIVIELPHHFSSMKPLYQEIYLKNAGISRSDTQDIIMALHGRLMNGRQIDISFASSPPVEEVPVVENFPEVEVTLPEKFGSLRPQDQYLYLKTELKLTGEQANDVLAVYKGQPPLFNKVIFKDS